MGRAIQMKSLIVVTTLKPGTEQISIYLAFEG